MTESIQSDRQKSIQEEFTRPLQLSVSQDLWGVLSGWIGRSFLLLTTCVSVLAVFLIFWFVIQKSMPFLFEGGIGAFFERIRTFIFVNDWDPTHEIHPRYGAMAIIMGSVYVTTISLLIAVPIGLLAALFLSDIAPFKVRQICKPIIEILAAIPSVAYGFFAFIIVAPWMQNHLGFTTGRNALNASIMLAIMALPTIISVAEDSLSAIGREIREASYGLGATRAETLIKVVIPASYSGIIAAVILGMMRAIGETMVVWMASGNAVHVPSPWWDLSQSIRTMTATIANELGDIPHDTMPFYSIFAVGLLLLIFTFVLNLVSEYFIQRVKKQNR